MATPTVVLPAPEPAEAPAAPAGPLAAILNPVEPARPVQTIGSTARLAEESAGTAPTVERSGKAAGQGGRQDSPFGALIRAWAARIGRTGTTNKVTRQHTINEQRATGNQSTAASRVNRNSDHRHSGQNHAQHQSARNQKLEDLRNKAQQRQDRSNRDARSNRGATSDRTSRDGRDVKDHRGAQTTGTTTAKKDDTTRTGKDIKTSGDPTQKPSGPPKDTAAPKDGTPKDPAPKPTTAKPDAQAGGEKPIGLDKTPTAPASTPRPRTQSSREAGYRDGTRAGAVVGHVQAYRDGVQDGFGDRQAADKAEKDRMDDAKARNARQPQTTAPAMQPASGSTVDLEKKRPAAQPVTVTGISASNVTFTDPGGAVITMGRVEVRTLRQFEKRMADKVPVMLRVAEASKDTRKVAEDLALRAQQLAERARGVEGGERLVRKLLRLAEETGALKTKAGDIEKAAVRGAEAVGVVVANAHTRHGGIYRAVMDSPLTKPAERDFYTDRQGG